MLHFNPRSHCRERPSFPSRSHINQLFQSTFPLQGTTGDYAGGDNMSIFQSTFPLQGTTRVADFLTISFEFQSTFPLQGTTYSPFITRKQSRNFNPRSHCRERQSSAEDWKMLFTFQSTFPLQGTTFFHPLIERCCPISIHVPIAGNDKDVIELDVFTRNFNPRSHCRERR